MNALRKGMALLLSLALLAGCAPGEPEETAIKLWFVSAGGEGAALFAQGYIGEASVYGLMQALLSGPDDGEAAVNPIPAGTRLLGWRRDEEILRVDLSPPYGDLAGIELTLADYCIALTLTQLPGVEGVVITVNGSELSHRDRQVLHPEDVVLSGTEEEPAEGETLVPG